jgi:hypothetical protein
MKRWWRNYKDLIIQWIIIVGFGGVVFGFYQYHLHADRGLIDYLRKYHCEDLGRVGQPGQAVYKCDNGLHLESDLRKETGT